MMLFRFGFMMNFFVRTVWLMRSIVVENSTRSSESRAKEVFLLKFGFVMRVLFLVTLRSVFRRFISSRVVLFGWSITFFVVTFVSWLSVNTWISRVARFS